MPANERMGSAASLGVAVGYGLTDRLTAEVSYRHWVADRGDAATGWLSGIWSLSRAGGRVQPFVLAGGGATNYAPDGRPDRVRRQGFAGFGLLGDVRSRVSWRVDVRAVRTVCSSRIEPHVQAGLTFLLGDPAAARRDVDGDGVVDSADACSDTPLGVSVDARGCPLGTADDDGDGVPNHQDECPGTRAGTETDAAGCPSEALDGTWVDSDGRPLRRNADGVWIDAAGRPVERAADGLWVDSAGRPLARQSEGAWVDSLGRPVAMVVPDGTWVDSEGRPLRRHADGVWIDAAGRPVERAADGLWVDSAGRPVARESDGVWLDSRGQPIPLVLLFGFDEAELGSDDARTLRRHAAFLRADETWSVRVEGHTDTRGRPGYNQALSERRAQAVRAALVSAGVEPDRIDVVGFGEDRPIAGSGDAANRRAVVIYVE